MNEKKNLFKNLNLIRKCSKFDSNNDIFIIIKKLERN